MNKSELQDIQQALNAISSKIERTDDETKWAALKLMLGTSASVVALAKKMAKQEVKTVIRTVAVPKTKFVSKNHNNKRHGTNRLHAYSYTTTITKSTAHVSYYS